MSLVRGGNRLLVWNRRGLKIALKPTLTSFVRQRAITVLLEAKEFVMVGPNNPASRRRLELASMKQTTA